MFQMDVEETFFFQDGTIVFAGPIQSEVEFIRACDCEIVQNGKVKASLRIDGEMLPMRKRNASAPSNRAVSTRERLDLAALGLGTNGFQIRSKD